MMLDLMFVILTGVDFVSCGLYLWLQIRRKLKIKYNAFGKKLLFRVDIWDIYDIKQ